MTEYGQQAVHDARLVCDWAIDTSRRLRQVASAEREYVSVDLMGRLMRFVKRDEAPQLAEFEAKALATLDQVDKIERKALPIDVLESELRQAVAGLTPTALYEALFADRPDLRPSPEQVERERERREAEKARVQALDERQRIAWEKRLEANRPHVAEYKA